MTIKIVYYIQNSCNLDDALATLKMMFPNCIINREYIEMDFSEIEVIWDSRFISLIESALAPLM